MTCTLLSHVPTASRIACLKDVNKQFSPKRKRPTRRSAVRMAAGNTGAKTLFDQRE